MEVDLYLPAKELYYVTKAGLKTAAVVDKKLNLLKKLI